MNDFVATERPTAGARPPEICRGCEEHLTETLPTFPVAAEERKKQDIYTRSGYER